MSSLVTPTVQYPAPTGVQALYFGSAGGTTTRNYYVQAVYVAGRSQLSATSNQVTTTGLDSNDPVEVKWTPMPYAVSYNVFRVDGSSTAPTVGTNFLANTTAPNFKDKGSIALSASYITADPVYTAHAYYDFAVDGGGTTTITPVQSDSIPAGAIVGGGWIFAKAAATSGGSATVAVGTSAGSAANSIMHATAISSLTLASVTPSVATGTPFYMSAAGQIDVTIATAALTAGILEVIVTYVMSQ